MVCQMTYVTGLITPIKALSDLAHSRGALISVDGAHPLGMIDLDLKATGIDHYAAAGQKWLLAGTGSGVCYVKRDVQDRIWPLMGYADLKTTNDPKAASFGARKYELGGQRNVPGFMVMAEAMDFHEAIGKKNVETVLAATQHEAPGRAQADSRREAVDLGRSAVVGRAHAVLGARHSHGERGEGYL
jgi:selenocysteine lyase/cysteine desulfurase